MKYALFVILAVMLACAFVVAQETPPPAGTGSTRQPVPQNPQTPSPSPSTAQPSPGAGPAQPSSAPGAATNNNKKISPGSVIPALLAKTVDAKKAKKGDEVVAKVPQDLPSTSGQVLVPKDTKVVGHVTEVQPRSKEQKESQLAISFDRLEMKNGEQMQLPMSIQAVIAPPNRNANENQANNQGGTNEPAPASPSAGTGAPTGAGARGGTSGGNPSQGSTPENTGNASSGPQNAGAARPQITGETKGVVGIPNLSLAATPDPTQGSIMTSEKNNVKLEDGTFLLLRVSPSGSQAPAPQSSPMPQQ